MRRSILYCILVHDSPRQTLRLLRAIYNRTDHFVVHVDRSAAPEYKNLLTAVSAVFPRIQVISNHICAWGGYSLVAAEIDMIRRGLELDDAWSHTILLSGTHLPVWPMAMIRDWVDDGVSFMVGREIPNSEERPQDTWICKAWDRINYYYDEIPGLGMKRGNWSGPPAFKYEKGSQWNVLARTHAAYAVRPGLDPIKERLARTAIPDEAFFQTVICNSEFRNQRDGKQVCGTVQWANKNVHPWIRGPWIRAIDGYRSVGMSDGAPFIRKIADALGDEVEVERAIGQMIGPVEAPKFGQMVLAHLASTMQNEVEP